MMAMTTYTVQTATESEQERCIAVLTLAFSHDPGVRWLYPDPDHYLVYFPRLVRAFGGGAFRHGTTHYIDGFPAAALWLPPGTHPDEETLMALIDESIPRPHRDDVLGLFEQMNGCHPGEPHWYLPLIGTDPCRQRNGCGSALLQHASDICDEQRLPAYLEATSQTSVPLYQRHGFRPVGTIQSGTSPPLIPMIREPRTRQT